MLSPGVLIVQWFVIMIAAAMITAPTTIRSRNAHPVFNTSASGCQPRRCTGSRSNGIWRPFKLIAIRRALERRWRGIHTGKSGKGVGVRLRKG
jgi:hypothetical protein